MPSFVTFFTVENLSFHSETASAFIFMCVDQQASQEQDEEEAATVLPVN